MKKSKREKGVWKRTIDWGPDSQKEIEKAYFEEYQGAEGCLWANNCWCLFQWRLRVLSHYHP